MITGKEPEAMGIVKWELENPVLSLLIIVLLFVGAFICWYLFARKYPELAPPGFRGNGK